MLINQPTLEAINKGFSRRFQDAFTGQKPMYPMICTEIPSAAKEEVHGFLDRIPKAREWLGERVINNLAAREFAIKNRHFENTFAVDRDDIEDDRIGIYNPSLDMLGQDAAMYPDDLILALLEAGTTGLCYDGQYFFDTDHPKNIDDATAGTQANLFTTTALNATNYGAKRAAMRKLVGADGRPLGVNPTHLIVPPALEETARLILNGDFVPNAAGTASETNVWKGTANLVVWDRLTSDSTWYLVDQSKPIRPFIFQNRKPPEFTYLTQPTADNVFMQKKFLYGYDARGNAGYALWFLAIRCEA
jgi:phage major head subunit gpT-like protein